MKRREPRFVNSYFFKILLSYGLVIFVGMGLVYGLTTSLMTRTLTEKESRVDREIVRQVQMYSDDTYRAVQNIFARLYLPLSYYNNSSIMDSINPRRLETLNPDTKQGVISSYLQDICGANDFISDIFIVDYGDRSVFFTSSVAGRDPSLTYDFYGQDLLGGEIDNKIRIIPNHIPGYINSNSVNNYSVISYGIYLFDINALRFDHPLGYCVINVWADHFKEAYQSSADLNGTVYVVDREGVTLFDSSGALDGQPFDGQRFGIADLDAAQPNGDYVINTLVSDRTGYRFMYIVDRDVIRREVGAIRQSLYGILLVCVLLALGISLISATLLSRRIRRLARNMERLERGEFNAAAEVSSRDEIGYLESSFNDMVVKLDKHIQTAYVYELKSRTAELKALQAQIDPHFLFNTLESIRISAMMNHDPDTARMIHILGNLFRWNIKTRGMFVELGEEIDHAGAYIELQKIRYADAFHVETDVPRGLEQLGVPKFILQPLVENAIKHGLMGAEDGGVIRIAAREAEGCLTIAVADNGRGMDGETVRRVVARLDEPEAEPGDQYSIGLSNVHQRIRMLFGEPYGLKIESESGAGTVVSIVMPAQSKEAMEAYVQSNHRG